MTGHETCVEKTEGGQFFHECPPCEHGMVKGFTMLAAGVNEMNARQRQLKIRTLDELTCEPHEAAR